MTYWAFAVVFIFLVIGLAVKDMRDEEEKVSALERKYDRRIEMVRFRRDGTVDNVGAKLLMHKECEMKYGPGGYEVEWLEHKGVLYYTARAKGIMSGKGIEGKGKEK